MLARTRVGFEADARTKAQAGTTGAVLWPTGTPAYKARVEVLEPGATDWSSLELSEWFATFEFGALPLESRVRAAWPPEAGAGLRWTSDEVALADLVDRNLVLEYVEGRARNAYLLSGRVRMADGSLPPEYSRVCVFGRPNGSPSEYAWIHPVTGEFLIPHTGWTHYGLWETPYPVEEWEFVVETHDGGRARIRREASPATAWERGIELVMPELPAFEGFVTTEGPRETPVLGATVFYRDQTREAMEQGWIELGDMGLETAAVTDEAGHFRFFLDPERVPFELQISKLGFEEYRLPAELLGTIRPGATLHCTLSR